MRKRLSKYFPRLLWVYNWGIVFESRRVIYVINIQNSGHILTNYFKYFFKECIVGIVLILYFQDYFLLQNKESVEQGLIVSHQLFFYALPHIIWLSIIIVAIQNIPTFHKSRVFSEHGILHIFEIVFRHLVIHLILEML